MKVLFLHLSDMHFVSDSSYTKKDCEEIANAVAAKIICPISMIFLVKHKCKRKSVNLVYFCMSLFAITPSFFIKIIINI